MCLKNILLYVIQTERIFSIIVNRHCFIIQQFTFPMFKRKLRIPLKHIVKQT